MPRRSKNQRQKIREGERQYQLGQKLKKMELVPEEEKQKEDPTITPHEKVNQGEAEGDVQQDWKAPRVRVTYLKSPNGKQWKKVSEMDEIKEDCKTHHIKPEKDIDGRWKAFCSVADAVMAKHTRIMEEIRLLRAETEALFKRHDEMKASATASGAWEEV